MDSTLLILRILWWFQFTAEFVECVDVVAVKDNESYTRCLAAHMIPFCVYNFAYLCQLNPAMVPRMTGCCLQWKQSHKRA